MIPRRRGEPVTIFRPTLYRDDRGNVRELPNRQDGVEMLAAVTPGSDDTASMVIGTEVSAFALVEHRGRTYAVEGVERVTDRRVPTWCVELRQREQ